MCHIVYVGSGRITILSSTLLKSKEPARSKLCIILVLQGSALSKLLE